MFKEDNTTEQMILSTLQQNGWKYIPADKLQRDYSDIYVESMVKNALIRLNNQIKGYYKYRNCYGNGTYYVSVINSTNK